MSGVSLTLPPEVLEQLAQRVAEILEERQAAAGADGWLRGADAIADYIGAKRDRVYALANCHPPRIPIHRDGSALLARRSELDAWIQNGGGRRP